MNGLLGAGGMAADGRTRVIRAGIGVLAIVLSWWLLAGVAECCTDARCDAPAIAGDRPGRARLLSVVTQAHADPPSTATSDGHRPVGESAPQRLSCTQRPDR